MRNKILKMKKKKNEMQRTKELKRNYLLLLS